MVQHYNIDTGKTMIDGLSLAGLGNAQRDFKLDVFIQFKRVKDIKPSDFYRNMNT